MYKIKINQMMMILKKIVLYQFNLKKKMIFMMKKNMINLII